MILPIVAYGDPVLRRQSEPIREINQEIKDLIANMWETMYHAKGVGLAGPQVGVSKRIFVVDASPFSQDEELIEEEKTQLADFRRVFINAQIMSESGESWPFNEGCLSIPDIREDVVRRPIIVVQFCDESMQEHTLTFKGIIARIIQHEYDHIQGVLFTDHLSPFKRRLLKGKLEKISRGKVDVDYRMKFPSSKRR